MFDGSIEQMGSNSLFNRVVASFKSGGTKAKKGFLGVIVTTKEPIQSDKAGRSFGAGMTTLPKIWDRVYGEHTARELIYYSYKEPMTYSSIRIIIKEKNRRGLVWKEEYAAKCPKCGKEYPSLPDKQEIEPEESPSSNPFSDDTDDPLTTAKSEKPETPPKALSSPEGGAEGEEAEKEEDVYNCEEPDCDGILETPDPGEYQEANELLKQIVPTDPQVSLTHLMNVHDRDNLTLGNGYYFAMLDYHLGVSGEIINEPDLKDADGEPMVTVPRGITTAPEETIKKIEDDYGNKGGIYWVCLVCRDKYDNYRPAKGSRKNPPVECPHCKATRLYDVHIIVSPNGEDEGDGCRYFIEGEYHWTPFGEDGLRFSFSPVEVLSDPILIKIYGYRYWLNIYRTKQSNNVLKWVSANSLKSFKDFVSFMKQAFATKEEAWIMADSEAKGQPAGAIKLDYDAQQLDAVKQNDQLDNTIATLYGVTPSTRGSAESGVGLGNDSMDVTIQAGRVQGYQDISNEGWLWWYAKFLWDIKAWRLEHVPPEPENDAEEEERVTKVLDNAEKALKLGIKVERREGTDRLENIYTGQYEDPDEMKANQDPFGGEGDEEDFFGKGQGPDMFGKDAGAPAGGDAFGGKRPPQFGGKVTPS
jgi:hypothetical protein